MAKYLVKLQPLNTFFFGNERTLGIDNDDYLVKSNPLPQQTALLGLMRYRLLQMKGWLTGSGQKPSDKEKSNLIGDTSFTDSGKKGNYGAIKNLSPLFLLKEGTVLTVAPKDLGFILDTKTEVETLLFGKNSQKCTPLFRGFDPKKEISLRFISENGVVYDLEDLFTEIGKVGIRKSVSNMEQEDQKDSKEGFFKQYFFRFKSRDTSFAFVVDIDLDGENKKLFEKDTLIEFGAERSMFNMSVDILTKNQEIKYLQTPTTYNVSKPDTGYIKVVLISDAYLTTEVYKKAVAAISMTVDFRYVHTSKATTFFQDMSKSEKDSGGKRSPYKSGKANLLACGSVFYFKNKIDFEVFKKDILQGVKSESFRQIGYNYFYVNELQTERHPA